MEEWVCDGADLSLDVPLGRRLAWSVGFGSTVSRTKEFGYCGISSVVQLDGRVNKVLPDTDSHNREATMVLRVRIGSIALVAALVNGCATERVGLEVTETTEVTGQVIPLGADCNAGSTVTVSVEVVGVPAESVQVQALCDAAQVALTDATVGAGGAAANSTATGTQTTGQAGCKVSPAGTTSTFTATCSFQ